MLSPPMATSVRRFDAWLRRVAGTALLLALSSAAQSVVEDTRRTFRKLKTEREPDIVLIATRRRCSRERSSECGETSGLTRC